MEGCNQLPVPLLSRTEPLLIRAPQYLLCAFYPFTSSLFSFRWKSGVKLPVTQLCSPPAHHRDHKGTRGPYMALSTVPLPRHAQQGGRNRASLPSSPMPSPSPQNLVAANQPCVPADNGAPPPQGSPCPPSLGPIA